MESPSKNLTAPLVCCLVAVGNSPPSCHLVFGFSDKDKVVSLHYRVTRKQATFLALIVRFRHQPRRTDLEAPEQIRTRPG
jgi:hypothetical protein